MRNSLNAAAAAILLTLISTPALADVKSGIDAWESGDYPAAIAAWRPLADQGDADAQFNLGQAYRFGKGVPVDLIQAEQWYRRAADQGHRQAEDNLGLVLFQNGKQKAALPLIRQAADRGDARAQFVLGTILFNGDLAPRDWATAYAYSIRAANAGLQRARLRVAEMDRYLSQEDRERGRVLAQKMESAAPAPAVRLLPAPASPKAPAPTSLLSSRGAALPPPPQAPTLPPAPAMQTAIGDKEPADSPPAIPAVPAELTPAPIQPAPASAAIKTSPASTQLPPPRPSPISAPRNAPISAHTPAPHPAPAKAWRVQLGAFADPASARRQWQKIKPRLAGFGSLQPFYEKAGAVTRLRAGPLVDRAAGMRLCRQAKAAGQDCLVIAP